jgi:Holliday junction DNA helicase RuvB
MDTATVRVDGRPVPAEVDQDGRGYWIVHNGTRVLVPGSGEVTYNDATGRIKSYVPAPGLDSVASRMGLHVTARPVVESVPAPVVESKADRPRSVVEMIGQDRVRTQLMVRVRGAKLRGTHPGHVLLTGPPGLGKTSIAELVAQQTGGEMIRAIGSALSKPETLVATLNRLARGRTDVLFIDEVHELPQRTEELLYTVMEDGRVDVAVGSGARAGVRSVQLPEFILVGATTLPGLLSQPFRDRFASVFSLEYYSTNELTRIIEAAAQRAGAKIDTHAAGELARRSRGTARVALGLFRASWDYTVAMADSTDVPITVDTVSQALELDEVDTLGLTRDDRSVLDCICRVHSGGPVGLDNLAATAGVDNRTLTGVIEPFLLREELIRRERVGRVATVKAFVHLGLDVPPALGLDAQCS